MLILFHHHELALHLSLILVETRPKWPISINCRNIWPNSTVCEIISHLPLFGVLELGELEYPIFLFQRGTWRWHLNLKNTLGTRAHEARVLLSHYPTLKTIFYIFYPQQSTTYPTHNRAQHTHRPNLSVSLSPSHFASQSRDLPLNIAIIPHRLIKFSLSISRSASFSVVVSLSVSLSRCCSRSRSPSHKVCLAPQLACSACGYFCL